MIGAQANNPLKFSPTVEVALAHLLGPGVRGFMPAEAAIRRAGPIRLNSQAVFDKWIACGFKLPSAKATVG